MKTCRHRRRRADRWLFRPRSAQSGIYWTDRRRQFGARIEDGFGSGSHRPRRDSGGSGRGVRSDISGAADRQDSRNHSTSGSASQAGCSRHRRGKHQMRDCRPGAAADRALPVFRAAIRWRARRSAAHAAADADLFRGRTWVLTPEDPAEMESEAAADLVHWLQRIGAKPLVMGPEEHDRVVSLTSHLAQLASTALASTVSERLNPAERLPVAGPRPDRHDAAGAQFL